MEAFIMNDQLQKLSCRQVRCFVIMPSGCGEEYSGKEQEAHYILDSIIRRTIHEVASERQIEIVVESALHDNHTGNINDAIIKCLDEADIVIADLTGRNPNVYYELGIRHALSMRHSQKMPATILMIQRGHELPFDVKPERTIIFSMNRWDPDDGHSRLKATLHSIFDSWTQENEMQFDSPVARVLRNRKIDETQFPEPSQELKRQANNFRRTWVFHASISIVASSVETEQIVNREKHWLARHFTHATGSGQFYALERLLLPLSIAYPDKKISTHLTQHVQFSDLGSSDLILLGGAPTNEKTKDLIDKIEGLPYKYDAPGRGDEKRFAELRSLTGGKSFKVIFDESGHVKQDFGIIIWTRMPGNESRRLLLLFGGTTYGTEAAAYLVVDPPEEIRGELTRLREDDNFWCVIGAHSCGHRIDAHSIKGFECGAWHHRSHRSALVFVNSVNNLFHLRLNTAH